MASFQDSFQQFRLRAGLARGPVVAGVVSCFLFTGQTWMFKSQYEKKYKLEINRWVEASLSMTFGATLSMLQAGIF